MDSVAPYMDIGQWLFFVLTACIGFLSGRIFSTGRKTANAIECASRIPEIIEGLKVAMKVQKKLIIYQRYDLRLHILAILRPDDTDEKLHQIQADMADEMEKLGK